MYIHRIIIRGMKNSPDLDLTFYNDWRDEPLRSILITGPNGSGKTTLLRVIDALWQNFASWLRLGYQLSPEQQAQNQLLLGIDFAAIELRDLPKPLFPEQPILLIQAKESYKYLEELYPSGKEQIVVVGEPYFLKYSDGHISSSLSEWFQNVSEEQERHQLGVGVTQLPNMIYLDAENRQIPPPQSTERPMISGEPFYQWAVTYRASERRQDNLESMLRNLKVRDSNQFREALDSINQFFVDTKQLNDFDQNLRLRVKTKTQQGQEGFHYIEDLSSGEKQCLLLIFIVHRWLMPGGVVLIDEPDLHLHVSLQRQLIRTLEQIVEAKQGQLIITSHSPTVWEEYSNRQTFTLKDEEWQKTTGSN